jgi:scyllo-inositol 2-dehydrogenase (NADP+)
MPAPLSDSIDPSNPIRIAIVGLGRAGRHHLERLSLRSDFRVVAVCDTDPAALRNCREFDAAPHSDWTAFLRDEAIEAVLIATPPAEHFPQAIDVLRAGRHALVETPLCLRIADSDALLATAARSGRCLSVLHSHRWDDDFRTARAMIAAGQLGQVLTVKWNTWQFNPRPVEIGDGPRSGMDWQRDPMQGGGVLWRFGSRYFDQLLQLAGAEPVSVFARWLDGIDRPNHDDSFLAVVTFANGVIGEIEIHQGSFAPLKTGWIVNGTRGGYSNLTHFSSTPENELVDVRDPPRPTAPDELYTALVGHLRYGEPNPLPGEQARRVVAVIDATRRSAESGSLQEVVT